MFYGGACDPDPAPDASPEAWPSALACEGLDDWPDAWSQLEADAVQRIDEVRGQVTECGDEGKFVRTPTLRRRTALDCAARAHARDMAQQQYVGRYDQAGRDEDDRAADAGYSATEIVQHIAAGPITAEELIDDLWLSRDPTCADLVTEQHTELGLGYVGDIDDEFGTYWVVVLSQTGQ